MMAASFVIKLQYFCFQKSIAKFLRMTSSKLAHQFCTLEASNLVQPSNKHYDWPTSPLKSRECISYLRRANTSPSNTRKGYTYVTASLFHIFLMLSFGSGSLSSWFNAWLLSEILPRWVAVLLWLHKNPHPCKWNRSFFLSFIYIEWFQGEGNLIVPIHAFPVMNTADIPTHIDFDMVPIGQSCVYISLMFIFSIVFV
jgi:hypothetical protein